MRLRALLRRLLPGVVAILATGGTPLPAADPLPPEGTPASAIPAEPGTTPGAERPGPASGAVLGAAGPVEDARIATLRKDLAWILTAPGWRRADWGVLAVSLETGDTLFARDPHTPRVPASNAKLLTTAAALHYLGPDFRYPTWVLTTGEVVDGRLRGDVILYGTGDPAISDRFYDSRTAVLEGLAAQLRERGIHTVEGRVLGDGTFFEGPVLEESWDPEDLNEWFAAPVAALSFNENVVTLRIEAADRDGLPPRVHTIPEDRGLPVVNEARTGWGRAYVRRDHPREPITITGNVPRGGGDVWRRLTVRDPVRYAAQVFRQVLEAEGIDVRGEVATARDPEDSPLAGAGPWAPAAGRPAPRILARHLSPPLLDILEVVNKESHNLLAETTFKTLGRMVEGEGSYDGGARAVRRFVEEVVGVEPGSVAVVDGSGLSDRNRVTPGALVEVLEHMARSDLWDPFWATLPEAGNRRELGRMYRTAAAGNLRAKTGTIRGVSALSGVVRSASGEHIAFSIVGNDLPSTWAAKRTVEDRIGVRLATFRRPLPPVVHSAGNEVEAAGTVRPRAAERPGSGSAAPVARAADHGTRDTRDGLR